MPNFLTRLASRATGVEPVVQPAISPAFAAVQESTETFQETPQPAQSATDNVRQPLRKSPDAVAPDSVEAATPSDGLRGNNDMTSPGIPVADKPQAPVMAPLPQSPAKVAGIVAEHPPQALTSSPYDAGRGDDTHRGEVAHPEFEEVHRGEAHRPAAKDVQSADTNVETDVRENRVTNEPAQQLNVVTRTQTVDMERTLPQPEPLSPRVESRRERPVTAAPVVNVSIGRIEVRAVMQQPPQPKPVSRPAPTTRGTLEEYLNNGRRNRR